MNIADVWSIANLRRCSGLGPAEAVPLFTPPSATRYADYTR